MINNCFNSIPRWTNQDIETLKINKKGRVNQLKPVLHTKATISMSRQEII